MSRLRLRLLAAAAVVATALVPSTVGALPAARPRPGVAVSAEKAGTLVCRRVVMGGCGTTTTTPGTLTATPIDAGSARLTWLQPKLSTTAVVLREGRVLDVVPAAARTYTDRLLWGSSTYRYTVRFEDGAGTVMSEVPGVVTTPPRTEPFPRPFSPDSYWNRPIPADAPSAPTSAAMVALAVTPYAAGANLANSDKWGVAVTTAEPTSKLFDIRCTLYDCGTAVSGRIPAHARPATGSDMHLAVVQPDGSSLDMYKTVHDPATSTWSAGSRFLTRTDGTGGACAPGVRCNSAVAAGFALMGGVIRPEELAQGRIDHALVFTTPATRRGVIACPASHSDGKLDDPAALPEGARIQLDPTFPVDAQPWPVWKKAVARALQQYGAYLGDTGGSLAFRAESGVNRGYDAWAAAGVTSSSLRDLPWDRVRVLAYTTC